MCNSIPIEEIFTKYINEQLPSIHKRICEIVDIDPEELSLPKVHVGEEYNGEESQLVLYHTKYHIIHVSPEHVISTTELYKPGLAIDANSVKLILEYCLIPEFAHYVMDFLNDFKIYDIQEKIREKAISGTIEEEISAKIEGVFMTISEESVDEYITEYYVNKFCPDSIKAFNEQINSIYVELKELPAEEQTKMLGRDEYLVNMLAHVHRLNFESLEDFRKFIRRPIDELSEDEKKVMGELIMKEMNSKEINH